jgi:hypothetical protein
VLSCSLREEKKLTELNGLRRSVRPDFRAWVTSIGLGIRVLRYLATGVISAVVREQKCRRRTRDMSNSADMDS